VFFSDLLAQRRTALFPSHSGLPNNVMLLFCLLDLEGVEFLSDALQRNISVESGIATPGLLPSVLRLLWLLLAGYAGIPERSFQAF